MTDTIAERHPDMDEISRAKRLKIETRELHERLDKSITAVATFTSVAGYGRFLSMQYLFHRHIDAIYVDPRLQSLFADLVERRRLPLIELDLADIGLSPPAAGEDALLGDDGPIDPASALGWLYVSEGSNLGASLLRREVAKIGLSDEHGARHLAPAPEGPAAHWRGFTTVLDSLRLSDDEEARVVAGARSAFTLVQALADVCIL